MKKNSSGIKFILAMLIITVFVIPHCSISTALAADDNVIVYDFAMTSIKPTNYVDSAPIAYNKSWNDIDRATYQNRVREDSIWKSWFDINYNTIGSEKNFTAFCMEFTNETRVPGLCKDFSAIKDNAYAIFTLDTDATVDLNNLYLAVQTISGDERVYAGVPVNNYITETAKGLTTVCVPFAEFEKSSSYIGTKSSNTAVIDFSKFSGMGLVRKAQSGSQSTGKVYFTKMAVGSVSAPTNVEASNSKNKAIVSFKTPLNISVKEIIINITDSNNNERNVTVLPDALTISDDVYLWTDEAAEVDVTYTYKIKIKESVYEMYSPYSQSVEVYVAEDYSGEEIPTNGLDTKVLEFSNRDYTWPLPTGIKWFPSSMGSKTVLNDYENASSAGFGTGRICSYAMNYNMGYENSEEAALRQEYVTDWYWSGYRVDESYRGGASGKDRNGPNILKYKDTAYVSYEIKIDEGMDLNNLYFALFTQWADGIDYMGNIIGLPASDFVKEEDKGKILTVSIPLSKFNLNYPGMYQTKWTQTWNLSISNPVGELDFQHFYGIGFLRDNANGATGVSSGKIYCANMAVSDVLPVTDFAVKDIKADKVILEWTHTKSLTQKYNVYRKAPEADEAEFIGESTSNVFVDTNNGNSFETEKTYTYYVEAVDKYNAASPKSETTAYISKIDHPRNFNVNPVFSEKDEVVVDVSWSNGKFGDIGAYILYRNGVEYKRFTKGETSFKDEDVIANETYEYHMACESTDGSAYSMLTKRIKVLAAALSAPENFDVSIINKNTASLSWTPTEYAQNYLIYLNGNFLGKTSNTMYDVTNLDFNHHYIFSIKAQNAGGAVSKEKFSKDVFVSNPRSVTLATIFDETFAPDFSLSKSSLAEACVETGYKQSGEKSIFVSFPEISYVVQNVSLENSKGYDMSTFIDDGNNLTFWVYANKNMDFSLIDLALSSKAIVGGNSFTAKTKVNLGNYVSGTNEWKYVSIPLNDFSKKGIAEVGAQKVTVDMEMNKIRAISFLCNNNSVDVLPEFYFDNMQIEGTGGWNVTSVKDGKNNTINSTTSANTDKFVIEFDVDMNEKTLNSSTVKVSENGGNSINSFGEYKNKKYTISLLENLKQNTAYIISINGASPADGINGGEYKKEFTTDSSVITATENTLPLPNINVETSQSGAEITAKVFLDSNMQCESNKFDIKIAYDEKYLNVSSKKDVSINKNLSDSTVSLDNGKITVSYNSGTKTLNGELFEIRFSRQKSGKTTLELSGSIDVYNVAAEKANTVSVNKDTLIDIESSQSQSGKGGSTGGSGGTASAPAAGRAVVGTEVVPGGEVQAPTVSFSDLGNVEWAKDSIEYLAKNEYVLGYGDGTFRPLNTVTRAEFTKMCIMAFKFSTNEVESDFEDVDKDDWSYPYISAAVKNGIIKGQSETVFGSNEPITREDMCVIVYRAMKAAIINAGIIYDTPLFSDENEISDYAEQSIEKLYQFGIINGVSTTEFAPKLEVNRAMAAKVLYEVLKIAD